MPVLQGAKTGDVQEVRYAGFAGSENRPFSFCSTTCKISNISIYKKSSTAHRIKLPLAVLRYTSGVALGFRRAALAVRQPLFMGDIYSG